MKYKKRRGEAYFLDHTVCLLNDSFPPFIDGVANAVVNYAAHLDRYGYQPMVLTPDHPDADDSRFDYPVIRYPSIDLRKWLGYMAGVPFSPEVARQIKDRNVRLIHSHCPVASTMLARQLRQIVDAPIVLTYHTKFDIDIANVIHSKALQTGSKKVLVENIRACDEVWTVSRGAGENLRSLGYEGDYIVMPNGVDLPREEVPAERICEAVQGYDLPEGVPVYLFVGRMMWYKGLRIILDALARLHADGKDFRMVFIGDGADRPEVEQYAGQVGVAGKCIFTGALRQRQKLQGWYGRADLFLFPSTFDTNGLVVREAAASYLPSVLISGSCAAEDVIHGVNGFLIEENGESLYRLLKNAYDHRPFLALVGKAAAQTLYMSWADAVKLAADRYEIVMDRYRCGAYPRYRKPMEYFFKANGELMDDLGQLQQLSIQLRQHIRH